MIVYCNCNTLDKELKSLNYVHECNNLYRSSALFKLEFLFSGLRKAKERIPIKSFKICAKIRKFLRRKNEKSCSLRFDCDLFGISYSDKKSLKSHKRGAKHSNDFSVQQVSKIF